MSQDYILQAQGLTKTFAGFTAVSGVNLDVRRHDIHALIGPNGAGKTTCFNLLTRFLNPTSGRIVYNGRDITNTSAARVADAGLVRSFQISSVFSGMSVLENVRVALQRATGLSTKFWLSERRLARLDEPARALLADVGLEADANRLAGSLPYGRRRALELATTLALAPDMILLDEPMAGLGHEDIDPVMALIRRAAEGRTVLMVEHNMRVIAQLCDRVTVLRAGETLAEGSYAEVAADPRVIEAYVGGTND